MSLFPTNPTNGQQATVNGIVYTYNSSQTAWLKAGAASSNNVFEPVVLNDISNQFDGYKTVFDLLLNQSYVFAITDSKDVQVVVGGRVLTPYVTTLTYPWITPYDSARGFRVVYGRKTSTSVQLIVYQAPAIGNSSYVAVLTRSSTAQQTRYPFSASTIALGD